MAKFQKKPFVVDATRLKETTTVRLEDRGVVEVEKGDWIIFDGGQPKLVVGDLIFRSMYDPMDKDAISMLEDTA